MHMICKILSDKFLKLKILTKQNLGRRLTGVVYFCYKRDFMVSFFYNNHTGVVEVFNSTSSNVI